MTTTSFHRKSNAQRGRKEARVTSQLSYAINLYGVEAILFKENPRKTPSSARNTLVLSSFR